MSTLNLAELSSPLWFNLLPAEPLSQGMANRSCHENPPVDRGLEIPTVLNFLVPHQVSRSMLTPANHVGAQEVPLRFPCPA